MPRAYSGPRILIVSSALTAQEREKVLQTRLETKNPPGFGRSGGVKRELVGFSKAARLNLARELAQVACPLSCWHVTLTYGKSFPCTGGELSLEKNALVQGGKRAGLCGFWRMEFQRARLEVLTEWAGQVPHFHCLVWGCREQVDTLAEWWRNRTGNPSEHAVDVREGNEGKAMWYLSLHAMKMEQSPTLPVGRWWGFINRTEVRSYQVLNVVAQAVGDREVIWLKRVMRRKTGSRGSFGTQGFTWFLRECDHARILSWAHALARAERPRGSGLSPTLSR